MVTICVEEQEWAVQGQLGVNNEGSKQQQALMEKIEI